MFGMNQFQMKKLWKVRPKKNLGQHFLTDESIAGRIASSLTGKTRHLIEIGPGMGVLTKYLVNDACVLLGKAFSMGGISRYNGQLMTHVPGTACYRCLFPEPPAKEDVETCATVGVLGSIAGMLGTVQATECIKYLTGVGQLLTNSLLTFDALSMQWQRFDFVQRSDCALCGKEPTNHELKEYAFQPCKSK